MEFGRFTSYEDVLREQVISGSPGEATDRLIAVREDRGVPGCSAWMTCGGQVQAEHGLASLRLVTDRVIPRLG